MQQGPPNIISLLFSANDRYAMPLSVALYSMLAKADPNHEYHIFVLDYGITDESKCKVEQSLAKLENTPSYKIQYEDPVAFLPDNLSVGQNPTWGRIYALSHLRETRGVLSLIYLDCDVLIKGDISKLLLLERPTPMSETLVLAAVDVAYPLGHPGLHRYERWQGSSSLYFNAGVLVFPDLPAFLDASGPQLLAIAGEVQAAELRDEGFSDSATKFSDQDALNLACRDCWELLPAEWNVQGMGTYMEDRCSAWQQRQCDSPETCGSPTPAITTLPTCNEKLGSAGPHPSKSALLACVSETNCLFSSQECERVKKEAQVVHFTGADFPTIEQVLWEYSKSPSKPWSYYCVHPLQEEWLDVQKRLAWGRPSMWSKEDVEREIAKGIRKFQERIFTKFIITGGAGFLGSAIARAILKEGKHHEVVILDNLSRGRIENIADLLDSNDCKFLFADLRVEGDWVREFFVNDSELVRRVVVIHCASVVGGIRDVLAREWEVFRQTVQINESVAARCRDARVALAVYISTACCYPKGLQSREAIGGLTDAGVFPRALSEADLFPADPESGYGWAKLLGELRFAKELGRSRVQVLRFHNLYGPGMPGDGTGQVIPQLIRKAMSLSHNGKLEVLGSGLQSRDFLHVDDAVQGIIMIVRKLLSEGEIRALPAIPFGSGIPTRISSLADMIISVNQTFSGVTGVKPRFDGHTKQEGDFARCANLDAAQRLLGWNPGKDMKAGLEEVFEDQHRRLHPQACIAICLPVRLGPGADVVAHLNKLELPENADVYLGIDSDDPNFEDKGEAWYQNLLVGSRRVRKVLRFLKPGDLPSKSCDLQRAPLECPSDMAQRVGSLLPDSDSLANFEDWMGQGLVKNSSQASSKESASNDELILDVKLPYYHNEGTDKRPPPIYHMYNAMVEEAYRNPCMEFFVLWGDDIKAAGWESPSWTDSVRQMFDQHKQEAAAPSGFGVVALNDISAPGFPTFPIVGRIHLELMGLWEQHKRPAYRTEVSDTPKVCFCPREFVNQDADPFVFELYRPFNCASFLEGVRIENTIGGASVHKGDGREPRYQRVHYNRWQDNLLEQVVDFIDRLVPSVRKVPTIDVITPTYRTNMAYLRGIVKLEIPEKTCNVRFWIICDKPKAREIPEILKLQTEFWPKVRVRINEKNLGASCTRNRGLDESSAEWVLFLDDDVDLERTPDLIKRYLSAIEEHGENVSGFVGTTLFPEATTLWQKGFHMCYCAYFWQIARVMETPPWGVTANLCLRRSTQRFHSDFVKTGGGEDICFCLETASFFQKPLRSVPDAVAIHPYWEGGNFSALRFFRWTQGDGLLQYKFPEHNYTRCPNVVEVFFFWLLLVICFGGAHGGYFCSCAGFTLLAELIYETSCYCRTETNQYFRDVYKPAIRIERTSHRLIAIFFSTYIKFVFEFGHMVVHLRRGRLKYLCSSWDWHCGLNRGAILDEKRKAKVKFAMFVVSALLVRPLWSLIKHAKSFCL